MRSRKKNADYRRQLDKQNHLVAQIANTFDLVFTQY